MAGKRLRISPADRDEWLHRCAELRDGLGDGVPFVLILVVMTLRAQRLRGRGVMGHWRNPSIGRPARPVATAALVFVAGVVAMILLHGSDRVALMASVVWVCLCLVVLTGYVGQVSLAQMSFAGTSAFMLSHLSQNWGSRSRSRCCWPRPRRSRWAS